MPGAANEAALREMLHLQHAEAAELLDVYKGAWGPVLCHDVGDQKSWEAGEMQDSALVLCD